MDSAALRGSFVAVVTPMHNDSVDLEALRALVEHLVQNGADGIVPCGTTGESAVLDPKERDAVIGAVIAQCNKRVPVVAGVGTNDTRTTIAYAASAKALGADALLVVTPYYNKPNQAGLLAHFTAVADAVALPQIVYNVPGRTACKANVDTLAALARHPHILGTKDATADMVFASETIAVCGPDFVMLSGDDGTTLPFLSLGGHGTISVVANVAPKLMHDLCAAVAAGDWDQARRHHHQVLPLFRALFSDTSPIPVKAALALQGHIRNELRLPLVPMSATRLEAFAAELGPWRHSA